jgi:hypothetical protein
MVTLFLDNPILSFFGGCFDASSLFVCCSLEWVTWHSFPGVGWSMGAEKGPQAALKINLLSQVGELHIFAILPG